IAGSDSQSGAGPATAVRSLARALVLATNSSVQDGLATVLLANGVYSGLNNTNLHLSLDDGSVQHITLRPAVVPAVADGVVLDGSSSAGGRLATGPLLT